MGKAAHMSDSRCVLSLLVVSLTVAGAGAQTAEDIAWHLVLEGEGQVLVVIGERATSAERHAAEELARYVEAMSGARLPVVLEREARNAPRRVLVGRPETNDLVAEHVAAGRVQLSAERPGLDGFVLKTLPRAGAGPESWDLVLGGSRDRATLYAVYDLLERVLDVGFFWDGEFVPKRSTLALPRLDVAERPRFPIRQHLQACAFGYTTYPWEWAEWKHEIDWMAKRRQNRMMLDWGHPLAARVAAYARGLGIEVILPGAGLGGVSEDFRKAHRDARYVKMQWGGDPPYHILHPDDPLFVARGAEEVRKFIGEYGTDHIYNVDPYPEQTVFLPPEEIEDLRIAFARRTREYLCAADPEAVWYASGWALLAPVWPEPTARAFLQEAAKGRFYVCDIWADEQPIHPRYDYLYGADWGFGVLHAFGGNAGLRGDMAGLIRRVQEVAGDPRAERCVAFYINPEIVRQNILYYELAARLSWDPGRVDLERFVEGYARRRYGLDAAQDLVKGLRLLVRSVYSSAGRAWEPYYQVRPGPVSPDAGKYPHVSDLEAALRAALRQADAQQENRLYHNDMVDIGREWLGELFNKHFQVLCEAFRQRDRGTFDAEALALRALLDTQERLVGTRADYSVSALIEKAQRVRPDEDTARYIKDTMLTFAGRPWLRDYPRKDMQELLTFYYRPRVEAFIQAMADAFPRHAAMPAGRNLLANPGFEEGQAEGPAAWVRGFVHAGGSACRVAGSGGEGDYAGELRVPGKPAYANLYQGVAAQAGDVFHLSARVRVTGSGRASLHVDFLRGEEWPGTVIRDRSVAALEGASDWATIEGWFEAPPETVKIVIFCRFGGGQGTAWFDEVALREVPPDEAPILRTASLEAAYDAIEQAWLERDLPPYQPPEHSPAAIVREALAHWGTPVEPTPDPGPAFTIIENGSSDYSIVVPDDTQHPIPYAAEELRYFLKEISGVEVPIVRESDAGEGPAFLIGPSRGANALVGKETVQDLAEDGVFIKTVGGNVVLLGQNPRGQLYSVYVLLERYLGVRFLAHDCTVAPECAVVTLPEIDYAYAPPFMYRETLYFDSFPKTVAARQRLNGPYTECDETTGGKIAFHPYVHSFCKLVPPQEFFDEHPEYFSLVSGERKGAEVHSQLCLTNPEVLRIATERVLEWIRENPDVPIIDVSQNDGNGWCECEACMAVVNEEDSQHGPILRFVNAIADVVAEKHPDKWVETLAYAYSTKPPAITKPRDNVIIRLCHAGCYFHGFEACGLGSNFAQHIEAWRPLTQRIFIWHYATNFAHYIAPNQNLDGLAKDIKYYAAHGVNGVMVQGDYQSPGGELAELRQYLAAQLMWDPNRDPAMIRLEFCNGYYQGAANDVLEYLSLMDDLAKRPDLHAFGAWDAQDTVPPEFVAGGLAILSRARTRADTPDVTNRVSKLLLPLWYMQLTYPDRYGLALEDGGEVLREFKSVVEANKITHAREGGENMGVSWP